MKNHIIERILSEAEHIIKNKDTVRGTAKLFKVSKSTVHKDVTQRLFIISPLKALSVAEVLKSNFEEKHIRGGLSTKKYHESKRQEK
jgi:putative DeoR family transcriptional regulator (stage III sporulation protein D)